ncbi:MAG: S26 family signal peptidase [Pseudomonadota bacterium]
MKRPSVWLIIWVILGLVLLLIPTFLNPAPRLVYNPSASAQVGWYKVFPGKAFGQGDLVASHLPKQAGELANDRIYLPLGIPVIKTIGAVAGDEICRIDSTILLPDGERLEIKDSDHMGRALPQLPAGCFTLPHETVFLVSTRIETSFDSRYIGPVHTSLVLGPVRYIGGRHDVQVDAQGADLAGARALGADCKIKARSAVMLLAPCLHIIFHSAIWECAALCSEEDVNFFNRLTRRYFTPSHTASSLRRS